MKRVSLVLSTIAATIMMFSCGTETKQPASGSFEVKDTGGEPWVANIEEMTIANPNYRAAVWTSETFQLVLMSLKPGETIDLEIHEEHDQVFRVEKGKARFWIGENEQRLKSYNVEDD